MRRSFWSVIFELTDLRRFEVELVTKFVQLLIECNFGLVFQIFHGCRQPRHHPTVSVGIERTFLLGNDSTAWRNDDIKRDRRDPVLGDQALLFINIDANRNNVLVD